jgi:molybdenum-dependent DNA-binding transcriptional regulator ModE
MRSENMPERVKRAESELAGIKCAVQVMLYKSPEKQHGAYRRGVNQLCRGVIEFASIKKAVKHSLEDNPNSMSEPKIRRALRETEETFGFKIIERTDGHSSGLTLEGEVLHEVYEQLNNEFNVLIEKRFMELLDKKVQRIARDKDRWLSE